MRDYRSTAMGLIMDLGLPNGDEELVETALEYLERAARSTYADAAEIVRRTPLGSGQACCCALALDQAAAAIRAEKEKG